MTAFTAAAEPKPSDLWRWQLICIASVLVNSTLETMLAPALPAIRAQLHLTPSQVAWAFTALTLSAAVTMPLLGRLGDIFGARPVLVGMFITVAAGILLAVAGGTFEALVAGQALQGVGMALVPLAVSLFSQSTSDRNRVSTAPIMTAAAVSTAGGLLLAGLVLKWATYQTLYWIAFAPNVVIVILAALSLRGASTPRGANTQTGSVDWLGAFLLAVTLLASLVGLTLVEGAGWTSALVLSLLGGSAIAGILWIWRSLSARSPLIDLHVLRDPAISRTALIQFSTGFGTFSAFVLVPLLIGTPTALGGLGLDGSAAGYALAPFGVASILGPLLVAPLRKLFGVAFVMGVGTLFAVAAPVTLAFAPNIVFVAAATSALGLGIGLILTQTFDLVGSSAPTDRVASVGALVFVLKMIGAAIGGQVTATVVGAEPSAHGFFMGFGTATVAMVVAALAAFSLRKPRTSPATPMVQA